nr:MAG: ORF1 [Torque teno midi virus]
MPFYWWKRRNRWWQRRPRRNKYYKRRRFNNRYKRKRLHRRRRSYRTHRRRRRRKQKVRRKRKTLPIQQWQPDSITNCYIKGSDVLILGAQGKQFICYTDVKADYVPPKAPMGGGFAAEVFTLYDLYTDYKFHKNIWSATNINKDLVRYLRCKLTFFRSLKTDFIVSYQRQPPFEINKYTYPSIHPHVLLQDKHKKLILSKLTKPNGKLKTKMYIKPPKQMLSKWFFSRDFATANLFLLKASVCNFNFSYLGCCNTSNQISFFYVNRDFYKNANWGAETGDNPYLPYDTVTRQQLTFTYQDGNKQTKTTMENPAKQGNKYADSVSYDKGWFNTKILRIVKWEPESASHMANLPINVARYNPTTDSGKGNLVYLTSIHTKSYTPPTTDETILLRDLPIWLAIWGFLEYVVKEKKDKHFLKTHCVIISSTSILPAPQTGVTPYYLPLDKTFINGQAPYGEYVTQAMKANWFPSVDFQMETLNAIAQCGPYVPKYGEDRESNWELKYIYNFFFKFGGPLITDKEVTDPTKQQVYPVPGGVSNTIQIQNPLKQDTDSFLHSWDFRRGIITDKAFKRMCKHLQPDSDFQSDAEEIVPKKKARLGRALQTSEEKIQEMQTCLQELCKENIYQETQDNNLEQFIAFQQEQQLNIKRNILALLMDLKQQQQSLQLQTGLFH